MAPGARSTRSRCNRTIYIDKLKYLALHVSLQQESSAELDFCLLVYILHSTSHFLIRGISSRPFSYTFSTLMKKDANTPCSAREETTAGPQQTRQSYHTPDAS